MLKKCLILFVIVLFLSGCFGKNVVLVDGLPVSNYEVRFKTPIDKENYLDISHLLVRNYKKYEGKEFVIWPEYLDCFKTNRINASETEAFVFHVRILNPKRVYYSLVYSYKSQNENVLIEVYKGKLSYKNFPFLLPLNERDSDVEFFVSLFDESGEEIVKLGEYKYIIERRDEKVSKLVREERN